MMGARHSATERETGPFAWTPTLGTMPLPSRARRFCWDFRLSLSSVDRERRTSHYLSRPTETIGRDYFEGGNYVDHAAETVGQSERILALIADSSAVGPVLEVGCATGSFLEALGRRGIDGYGVDISEWAVARASETLGAGRVFRCDAELDPLPAELIAKAPFRTLILWAVFEHFRDPFRVLAKLSELAAPGAVLLLNTTNADSLCHRVFGQEWEGYFNGSHYGIDQVSVASVRRELAAMGWRIERMKTDTLGTGAPTRCTRRFAIGGMPMHVSVSCSLKKSSAIFCYALPSKPDMRASVGGRVPTA